MTALEMFRQYGITQAAYENFLKPTLLVGLFAPPEELSAAVVIETLYYCEHSRGLCQWRGGGLECGGAGKDCCPCVAALPDCHPAITLLPAHRTSPTLPPARSPMLQTPWPTSPTSTCAGAKARVRRRSGACETC